MVYFISYKFIRKYLPVILYLFLLHQNIFDKGSSFADIFSLHAVHDIGDLT